MPASGGDPVSAAIRLSLSAGQEGQSDIDKRLAASCSRVFTTHINYELAPTYQSKVLNNLKNKYVLLKPKNSVGNSTRTSPSISTEPTSTNMKLMSDSVLPTPKLTLFPPERVQLGWRGTVPVGAGFVNVGNSCYLNASLQALFHVPALVNWLHSDSVHLEKCSINNGFSQGECIICSMNKTLNASQIKSCNVMKPSLICQKLKSICKHLNHGQQEDAHEFMRYLIESMEKAYLTRFKGNKMDSYSKETTPLNQIFGGYMRTEVKCMVCQSVSTTFQHFQDLLLDIRRAVNVGEAMMGYFANERLDEADYRCDRCHKKVNAMKRFYIEKPPRVLCVQLKRFSIMGGKMNKHVSVPQRLDLTRFLCPQSPYSGRNALAYRLVAMVNHVGSSVNCGHYTAIARASTGQLYLFDDSMVRPISSPSIPDANAYIIIYESERDVAQNLNQNGQKSVANKMLPSPNQEASTSSAGQKSPYTTPNHKPTLFNQKNSPAVIPSNHKPLVITANQKNALSSFNHKFIPSIIANNKKAYTATSLPPANGRDKVVCGVQPRLNGLVPYDDEDSNGSESTPSKEYPMEKKLTSVLHTSFSLKLNGDATKINGHIQKVYNGEPAKVNGHSQKSFNGVNGHSQKIANGDIPKSNGHTHKSHNDSPVKLSNGKPSGESQNGCRRVKDATGAGWAVSDANSKCDDDSGAELEEGEIDSDEKRKGNKLKRKREPRETEGELDWILRTDRFTNGNRDPSEFKDTFNDEINSNGHNKTNGYSKTNGHVKEEISSEKFNGAVGGKPAYRDSNGKVGGDKYLNGKTNGHSDKKREFNGKFNGTFDSKDSVSDGYKSSSSSRDDKHAKRAKHDSYEETPLLKTNASVNSKKTHNGGDFGPQRWNDGRSDPSQYLKKQSHRGFGTNVNAWTGGRSHVDREAGNDWREARKRDNDRAYDDDLDRGRSKKVKRHNDDYGKSHYNKFQRYQDDQRQWAGGHSGKMYYNKSHGNRHKYRSGNGNKHHRDNWNR